MRRGAKLLGGLARVAASLFVVGSLAAWPSTAAFHVTRRGGPLARAPDAGPPPGAMRTVAIILGAHENLGAALARAGVGAASVAAVDRALADDFDIVNPRPGLSLTLRVADSGGATGPTCLLGLDFQANRETALNLTLDDTGVPRLSRIDTAAFNSPRLIEGSIDGSLYLSLVGRGVAPDTAAGVARAFGRRLDLARDIGSGDHFTLLFQQRRDGAGHAIGAPDLVFARIDTREGPARLYRVAQDGVAARDPGFDFIDGETTPGPASLLRTPVDGARVTSGYGPRMHPILGFSRMHQGVDFAAPTGAPVLAAGDGIVEEARWAGGYGRWLKIRHGSGLETGYAHLSAWAAGIAPGAAVRQGQVVAYVGSTGLATGPHLHFEVFQAGQRIDPKTAGPIRSASAVDGGPSRAARAAIDAEVAILRARCGEPRLAGGGCGG